MRPRTAEETERLLRYAPFTTTFRTKITYFFGISNNPAAAIHNALRLSCRAEGGRRRCGASAFTTHTRSTQPAKDETGLQSFARGGCGLPAQSADSAGCHVERRGGQPRSRDISTARNIHRYDTHGLTPIHPRDPSTSLVVTESGLSAFHRTAPIRFQPNKLFPDNARHAEHRHSIYPDHAISR